MATEEEHTKVADVVDAIEPTKDKDVTESHESNGHDSISHEESSTKHEDVPNATADLSEPKAETTSNGVPPEAVKETPTELKHEDTVEPKESTPEDVTSIEPVAAPAIDESQVALAVPQEEEESATQNDDEAAPAVVPSAEDVAPPPETITASVDEAEVPTTKEELHEAVIPVNESPEPPVPATTSDTTDIEASPSQTAVVDTEPELAAPAPEVIDEAVPSAPVDPVITEDQIIPAAEPEVAPTVPATEAPAPAPVPTENHDLIVLASSADETCYPLDGDIHQEVEQASVEVPDEKPAPQEPAEEVPESVVPEQVKELEPEVEVETKPEDVPEPDEKPTEEVTPSVAEVTPVVVAVPVVVPEEVPAEPETKEEVSPEVVDDKVEVKSEIIEPPNGHVESLIEEKVPSPSDEVNADVTHVDVLKESAVDVNEPASDEPRELKEETVVVEEAPAPAEVTLVPSPEEPPVSQEPVQSDAPEKIEESKPVLLAESAEICRTLPSPKGEQDAETTVCSSGPDPEELVVAALEPVVEPAVPIDEAVVEESGPAPPTVESLSEEATTSEAEDIVPVVSNADSAAAEEASRTSTEVLPPEIVVDEDRDPSEPEAAKTSDHHLITASVVPVTSALAVVDNAGEIEKTETQNAQDQVAPEVERPKSPWTPSYSVTTQGPGVTNGEVPDEVEVVQETADVPVLAEPAKVEEGVTGNGTALVPPESSGDSLSASAEDVSKSSWPKSYSVSSQGASPIHAPQKTEDDDVKPIETQLEKEAPQPAEAAVSPEPVEAQEAPAPAVPEPAAAPKEQELVVEIPTGTQAQEIAEPQARAAYKQTPTKQFFANWVALADPNHDDTGSLHSVHSEATGPETVFIPKLQVEGKAALAPAAPVQAPERPWTPSYAVTRQGVDDTDATGPAAEEEEADLEVRPFTPQEPKWTPSYSVSQQGAHTPTTNAKELVAEEPAQEIADEAPERPWTPSYSVTKQGSTPATPKKDGEWTPSYSVTRQGTLTPNKGENGTTYAEADRQAFPTSETAANGPKASEKSGLSRLEPLHEDKRVETRVPAQVDTVTPSNGRARLESTSSSKFFPGGWFSSSPKSPEEPSFENANGEFSKANGNGLASPNIEVPVNTPVDGLDHEKKAKWCVVM